MPKVASKNINKKHTSNPHVSEVAKMTRKRSLKGVLGDRSRFPHPLTNPLSRKNSKVGRDSPAHVIVDFATYVQANSPKLAQEVTGKVF